MFAPGLNKDYVITTKEMGYPESGGKLALVATRHHAVTLNGGAIPSSTVQVDTPVGIPITKTAQAGDPQLGTDAIQFEVVLVSPRLAGGWYFLGEPEKWVSVSSQRFSDISTSRNSASVKLTGAPGEKVIVAWQDPRGKAVTKTCVIPSTVELDKVDVTRGGRRATVTIHLVSVTTAADGYDATCK